MREIDNYFNNEEKIKKIAFEIVDAFDKKANKDNIDYSFNIGGKSGQMTDGEGDVITVKDLVPNTYFSFDPDKGTELNALKEALYSEDLKKIEEKSKEETELLEAVASFFKQVAQEIDENYYEEFRGALRKAIFPQSSKEDIPLKDVSIITVDVADFSSIPEPYKYLLKVMKKEGTEINTDDVVMHMHDRQEKDLNKTVQEIFEEDRLIVPALKNIEKVELGKKYLNEISVILSIDYSYSKNPPEVENA